MLAIRELQCKQNVKVSFAFVNVHGIGPFTTPKPKCFYGEVWLIICGDDSMSSERGVFALPVQEVGSLFQQMMCL